MGRVAVQIKKKIEILDFLRRCNKVKATSKHSTNNTLEIQPCPAKLIGGRKRNKNLRKSKNYSRAASLHKGREVEKNDLEKQVYVGILQQRISELFVFTTSTVPKALSFDPNLKEANAKELCHWVYPYLSF